MNIIELAQWAEAQVDQYRRPDVSKFVEAIDPILAAYGGHGIGDDEVSSVTVTDDFLYITTAYSVRGCSDSNDFRIPMSILEADDPILEAKKEKLAEDIKDLNHKITHNESMLIMHRARLEKLTTELKELA